MVDADMRYVGGAVEHKIFCHMCHSLILPPSLCLLSVIYMPVNILNHMLTNVIHVVKRTSTHTTKNRYTLSLDIIVKLSNIHWAT